MHRKSDVLYNPEADGEIGSLQIEKPPSDSSLPILLHRTSDSLSSSIKANLIKDDHYFSLKSPFNLGALGRNWESVNAVKTRLTSALAVLSTGHLDSSVSDGTHLRDASHFDVENELDFLTSRFTNERSSSQQQQSSPSLHVPPISSYDLHYFNSPPKNPGSLQTSRRGDVCPLSIDMVSIPKAGEAGTADIIKILGASSPLLQPETYLRDPPPDPSSFKKGRARAHALPGHWPKIAALMAAGGMCSFEEVGTVYENSVFGVLKTDDPAGPHRLLFSGSVANLFFKEGCGYVSLPSPDVLSQIRLHEGEKLYIASKDISQCYNRMLVPKWMRRYFGMPRVSSKSVGLPGPHRWVVPCLLVLPMGVIFAVRICQAVVTTIIHSVGPSRILTRGPPVWASEEGLPLDIAYLDDLSTAGTDLGIVNARNDRIGLAFDMNGLPTEPSNNSPALHTGDSAVQLGLSFWKDGFLSLNAKFFRRLGDSTSQVLSSQRCSPEHMSSLDGSWVTACLLRPPLLSLLFRVYECCNSGDWVVERRLPLACLRELSLLMDLAPLMVCSLKAPIGSRLFATDACNNGGAVTYADMPPAEFIDTLSETVTRKGWMEDLSVPTKNSRSLKLTTEAEDRPQKLLTVSAQFESFFQSHPFTTAIANTWKRGAHINNSLEMEAFLLAVRHARSCRTLPNGRVYFGLDSSVAFGVLSKGRSSSFAINTIARKVCAQVPLGNLWPVYYWIPTDIQPEDAPSRKHERQ